MNKSFDRREFFIRTTTGIVALNELFGPGILGKGVRLVSAAQRGKGSPSCLIKPGQAHYREAHTWTLTYTAGEQGLPSGKILMVRCMAAIKPEHNLTVTSSFSPLYYQVSVKENVSVPRVIWIEMGTNDLPPGETLTLRLMNYMLPICTAECSFAVLEVDPDGNDPEIGSNLTFLEVPAVGGKCLAQGTEKVKIIVPTRAQVDKPVAVKISVFDRNWLPTPDFTGTVTLDTAFPFHGLPDTVTFTEEDGGTKTIHAVPEKFGVARITVNHFLFSAQSNPCVCTAEPVEEHVLWGDYHQHSFLCDGHLYPEEHFHSARHHNFLDWAMISPHDMWPAPDKGARNWKTLQAKTEEANEPGAFITFHGYEWTHDQPFSPHDARGHKVVIFLDPDDLLPLLPFTYEPQHSGYQFMPPTTLLHRLKERAFRDVIVIPHHMPLFKWWVFPEVSEFGMGGPLPALTRREIDEMQPVAEVYSKVHGMNESYGLKDWIQPPTTFYGCPILHTFWLDGLMEGARVGVMCAGDNHYFPMGHEWSSAVTAVMAKEFTREGIFRAIQKRHTYGTSGPRVFLHFSINDAKMGDIANYPDEPPTLEAVVVSPLPVDYIEVVKVTPGAHEVAYTHPSAGAKDSYFVWDDTAPPPADWVCYYLRVHLDGDTQGAWTSPIWLER